MAPEKANGPKNEIVSPWELWEIERKQKRAGGAQRKELIKGIGSKANKPKGKDVVIESNELKKFSKNPWKCKN